MLSLKNITKNYLSGDSEVQALRGVSVDFRKSEFVSILGQSGCGKTTLLNIIGGLDRYTDGDLSISGRSTKSFSSSDWDSYRNHSVGFVFQSYNLIPHQTVLANVELALTLSGVSKAERKKRAAEALKKVGLEKQLKKKPNQLSGGQMQRVAIARALVNNPEILLADEPTGALDSETSVQIMDLLREIAEDRLVIMVTHNPELADKYSTRIIRLLDGEIVDDTDPYTEEKSENGTEGKKRKRDKAQKKTSMSVFTAISLSANNLLTKKGRSILVSFAGSIGIIGIALILALSNGIQTFIDSVQKDTLSSYPIQIAAESVDMNELLAALAENSPEANGQAEREEGRVYQNTVMYDMMNSMMKTTTTKNNLTPFKEYIESPETGIGEYVSAISYGYDITLPVYRKMDGGDIKKVNPSTVISDIYGNSSVSGFYSTMSRDSSMLDIWQEILPSEDGGINSLIEDQYDVIYGSWPASYDEVMLFVTENNELNDMVLYSLGLRDTAELDSIMESIMKGEEVKLEDKSWTYEELCSMDLSLILPTDIFQYQKSNGTWSDMSENETYMSYVLDSGIPLKITGIARPNETAVAGAVKGSVGYTKALTDHVISKINESDIAHQQMSEDVITEENSPYTSASLIGKKFSEVDVFTGLAFKTKSDGELTEAERAEALSVYASSLSEKSKAELYREIISTPTQAQLDEMTEGYLMNYPDRASLEKAVLDFYSQEVGEGAEEISQYLSKMSDEELTATVKKALGEQIAESYASQILSSLDGVDDSQLSAMLDGLISSVDTKTLAEYYDKHVPTGYSEASLEENVKTLGIASKESPSSINIYAKSFEDKEEISNVISKYNSTVENESDKITYTDFIALIMSSVSTIINAISYVLIAFVAISLVVSSIMIGIITYISVLERTKEIGILRSVGASKRDISRVFNAEALILGFSSGVMGILVTLLLIIPTNAIIRSLSGIPGISAILPPAAAFILVAISMFLTFIAGLIPSRIASNKDPVVALRTE